jgi:hypothetical protein
MSPEQLRGEEIDHRADLFAFGIVVFEMAAGWHPFAREDPASTIAMILESDPPDLLDAAPESPPELGRIVTRCLCKDRDERYVKTSDLVSELEQLERTSGKQRVPRDAASNGDRDGEASPPHGELATTSSERSSAQSPSSGPSPEIGSLPEAATEVPGASPARYSPLWWWRFHQIVIGIGYYTMLVPLWLVKKWTEDGAMAAWGSAVFFVALVPVGVAGILRIHLWFTSRYYPVELADQRRRARVWVHSADTLFILLLLSGAFLIAVDHASVATLLVAFAVGYFIAATMIEPTTSRAAFRDERRGAS